MKNPVSDKVPPHTSEEEKKSMVWEVYRCHRGGYYDSDTPDKFAPNVAHIGFKTKERDAFPVLSQLVTFDDGGLYYDDSQGFRIVRTKKNEKSRKR
jgi:hypothetical protein